MTAVLPRKPRVFIGSSQEAKAIADAVQAGLGHAIEAPVWDQEQFRLSEVPIESLERLAGQIDFAVLILTADDMREARGQRHLAPRDNLLFEAGFFVGRLSRGRTFLVRPRNADLQLPSDLAGVSTASYPTDCELPVALGPACTEIRSAVARLGLLASARPAVATTARSKEQFVPRPRRKRTLGTASARGPLPNMRIENISATGAFLESPGEIAVGTMLDLDLLLDNDAVVRAQSSVVRIQYPAWGRVGGVGVAFLSLDDESKRALESFVEPSLEAAGN